MDEIFLNEAGNEKSMSLINIFNILFKRKKIIITVFISVIIAVTIWSFLSPPVYRANSQLLLNKEVDSEKILLLGGGFREGYRGYDWITTEIAIIRSQPVAASRLRTSEAMSSGTRPSAILVIAATTSWRRLRWCSGKASITSPPPRVISDEVLRTTKRSPACATHGEGRWICTRTDPPPVARS